MQSSEQTMEAIQAFLRANGASKFASHLILLSPSVFTRLTLVMAPNDETWDRLMNAIDSSTSDEQQRLDKVIAVMKNHMSLLRVKLQGEPTFTAISGYKFGKDMKDIHDLGVDCISKPKINGISVIVIRNVILGNIDIKLPNAPVVYERSNCENDTDPFSMDEFATMDPKDIISIDGTCYNLTALFNWVSNLEKKTDPFTNLEFSEEAITRIKNAGLERFPMAIKITSLQGQPYDLIQSSSLISMERLIKILAYTLKRSSTVSLYRPLVSLAPYLGLDIIKTDGTPAGILSYLRNGGESSILRDVVGDGPDAKIYISFMAGPQTLENLIAARDFMIQKEWPTDTYDELIAGLRGDRQPQARRNNEEYEVLAGLRADAARAIRRNQNQRRYNAMFDGYDPLAAQDRYARYRDIMRRDGRGL